MMQFYELALSHLALQDQQQLRQMLNAAASTYLSAKSGIHESFTLNHHNMEYRWGNGGLAFAHLYTRRSVP
jgi:hypothetical protein